MKHDHNFVDHSVIFHDFDEASLINLCTQTEFEGR